MGAGLSDRGRGLAKVYRQPHLKPSATRDIGNISSQSVLDSAQYARLLASRVHRRVRTHRECVRRHRSLIRSHLRKIHQEQQLPCLLYDAPICDRQRIQRFDSFRGQHTALFDSTVSICNPDRFSGRESCTTQVVEGAVGDKLRWDPRQILNQRLHRDPSP